MMTYHSNTIKPFDIFYAEIYTPYGQKRKHYYVCIYAQPYDFNNPLESDVFGFVITTNQKYKHMKYNDYNAKVKIGKKDAYVCCDKMVRVPINSVQKKQTQLTMNEREDIQSKFLNFNRELLRQLQIKEKKT